MPAFSTYNGQIASRLDQYRALGQQEASQHRPPSDAAHPDVNETELLAEAAKTSAHEQHIFDSVVTKASVEVTQAEQKVIALKTSVQELLGEQPLRYLIESDLSAEKLNLIRAAEQRMRAETDWKFFRERNGIAQQAVYPDSRVGHLGWVAVAVLGETLVNAFFYENEQGLLGGFFVALAIAVVNMGSAFFLGYGFRYKNLRAVESKVAGWLCMIAFLLIMLYCNTLFAAFRAHYQTLADPSDPVQLRAAFAASSRVALGVFRLKLDLVDLWSFVLFGFGLLLSCISFWKGYTLDDEHPNYGALDRRFKIAREKEQQEQTRVRNLVRQKFKTKRPEFMPC